MMTIRLLTLLLIGLAHLVAAPVTLTLRGTVSLSELDDHSEEDLVSASFTYDTNAQGEVYTSDTGDLTEVYFTGITASFQNASKTLSVQTQEARITLRMSVDSDGVRRSLRLHFPTEDIPTPQTREASSFIGYVNLAVASPSILASGKLPSALEAKDLSHAGFLFAWNRFRGDEAPLEYGGQLTLSTTPSLSLKILPQGDLHFPTTPGKRYQIQYSDDLKTWHPLGPEINGTGSPHRQTMVTPAIDRRLFRVREE